MVACKSFLFTESSLVVKIMNTVDFVVTFIFTFFNSTVSQSIWDSVYSCPLNLQCAIGSKYREIQYCRGKIVLGLRKFGIQRMVRIWDQFVLVFSKLLRYYNFNLKTRNYQQKIGKLNVSFSQYRGFPLSRTKTIQKRWSIQ